MKNIKKILVILLCVVLLSSCGNIDTTSSDNSEGTIDPNLSANIGGIALENFAVTESGPEYSSVKKIIFELTGKRASSSGENTVLFRTDETLKLFDVRTVFDGKDLIIYTSGKDVTPKQAADVIYDISKNTNLRNGEFDVTQKVLPENTLIATNDDITKWRKKTDERIEEIKNTPNMEIPTGATVYYVSNNGNNNNDGKSAKNAWATIDKVNEANLKSGDFVLFERGSYFRGQLKVKSGVTYSAYGEGDKPIIVRSPEDGANKNRWVEVKENIWEYQTPFDTDVGTLVFNHGENHAVKWLVFKNESGVLEEYRTKVKWDGVSTIKTDLEFWHSTENKKIYLCSEENPGERFDSIEFLIREHAITGGGSANVTFDNLTVKYTGAHGIGGGYKENLKVQNCTFEWIGGSIQFVDYSRKAPTPVRFGNGVEIYGGCNGFTVDNCYFDQIYDAAVTHQYSFDVGSTSQEDMGQYNVNYTNNVMQHCVYSIEYFLGRNPSGNKSCMDNVLYENNLMWYAGQGLGSQRPDNTSPAHIKGWGHINPVKNFVIKNNLLVESTSMLIHTSFRNENADGSIGVQLIDNILVGSYGQSFGMFGYNTNDKKVDYNAETGEYLKDFSSGNKYYFFEE